MNGLEFRRRVMSYEGANTRDWGRGRLLGGLGVALLLGAGLGVIGCNQSGERGAESSVEAPQAQRLLVSLNAQGIWFEGSPAPNSRALAEELARRNLSVPISVRIEAAPEVELTLVGEVMQQIRAHQIVDIELMVLSPDAPSRLTGEEDTTLAAGVASSAPAAQASSEEPTSPVAEAAAPTKQPEPAEQEKPAAEPEQAEPEGLPEVVVKNVGLHVGGGKNTDQEKAPFRKAIERQFDGFRACYRQVTDPMKGGTFGVDLRIGRDGGQASLSQPRTSMGGQGFRDCVMDTFKRVQFEKPANGPTVISYSLRFSMQ